MDYSAIGVFASAFVVSACAGLASLLRSNAPLTWKSIANATLNSGILGLGIALLWYAKFKDNIYFLVGICVVAGLGGVATVDTVLSAFHEILASRVKKSLPKLPGEEEK